MPPARTEDPARAEDPLFDRRSLEALARFAHEARQPLSALRMAFELIRSAPDVAIKERASIVAERQFVQIGRLFEDMFELSRLHLGTTTLRVQDLDLRGLIEELTESVWPQVVEKHQQLAIQLPVEPVWMKGDPVRLQQVVTNLLVNGIKYTDPGGRLCVDLKRGSGDVVLRVSDNGRGISRDVLPHIFEPFMRGERRSDTGLGVGLAIARQLVELHGGTISASSSGPGQGSEFVVTLPAQF
jgi:signal transduction histidine kinase